MGRNNVCIMRMVDAEFEYTYEYQGNAQKLVHTPLTDKCYLTLTQGKNGFVALPMLASHKFYLYTHENGQYESILCPWIE